MHAERAPNDIFRARGLFKLLQLLRVLEGGELFLVRVEIIPIKRIAVVILL